MDADRKQAYQCLLEDIETLRDDPERASYWGRHEYEAMLEMLEKLK